MSARGLIVVAAVSLALVGSSFAKTASCPCSPCKCSPCTCGGSGGSKGGGGKHHDKEHGHDHGGSSVGVGGTVDLGGIGHRNAEPNPFAVGGGEEKPVAHTQEKHKTTAPDHEVTTSNPFDDVRLTGKPAKDENTPPHTFNISDETPPSLPPGEGLAPKATTADDVKKAQDDYYKAWSDWLKKKPDWNSLVHDWTQSPDTEAGRKKSAKAKKKIDKMNDEFNAGDGKQLVDDWKKAFDNALKSGATIDDNSLVPPARDNIEKKKYAVIKARNNLKTAQKKYDDKKQNGANNDEEVKKLQQALSDLGAVNGNDPKYKAAVADLNKAVNEAGAKWAATDEGKAAAKELHDAEKDLDKAKEDWKPFEKYEDKEAASTP